MTDNPRNEVISVISRSIKSGHEKDYDDWLRRYLTLERKASGYLGATIIIPGGGSRSILRYIVIRFTDKASMEAWENSPESLKLLEEVSNYSTRHYDAATGLETWFNLPDLKTVVAPPPRWKMIIVIFIAAYCISSLSRSILNPFIGPWPILASNVIYSIILVVSFTYLAMPFLNRLLRRWLYPSSA